MPRCREGQTRIEIWMDEKLKEEFFRLTRENESDATKTLRKFIKEYIKEHQKED